MDTPPASDEFDAEDFGAKAFNSDEVGSSNSRTGELTAAKSRTERTGSGEFHARRVGAEEVSMKELEANEVEAKSNPLPNFEEFYEWNQTCSSNHPGGIEDDLQLSDRSGYAWISDGHLYEDGYLTDRASADSANNHDQTTLHAVVSCPPGTMSGVSKRKTETRLKEPGWSLGECSTEMFDKCTT